MTFVIQGPGYSDNTDHTYRLGSLSNEHAAIQANAHKPAHWARDWLVSDLFILTVIVI